MAASTNGVDEFSQQLQTTLQGFERMRIPDEELVRRLDQAAGMYEVLIIKTTL